jgi:hypothetical protein
VHHIRKLTDLATAATARPSLWTRIMANKRRKTLIVCGACHDLIHTTPSAPTQ